MMRRENIDGLFLRKKGILEEVKEAASLRNFPYE